MTASRPVFSPNEYENSQRIKALKGLYLKNQRYYDQNFGLGRVANLDWGLFFNCEYISARKKLKTGWLMLHQHEQPRHDGRYLDSFQNFFLFSPPYKNEKINPGEIKSIDSSDDFKLTPHSFILPPCGLRKSHSYMHYIALDALKTHETILASFYDDHMMAVCHSKGKKRKVKDDPDLMAFADAFLESDLEGGDNLIHDNASFEDVLGNFAAQNHHPSLLDLNEFPWE